MKISIFGLGYVGCVGMGCLASSNHQMIGVDINPDKVELINRGIPTIIEKDIDKLISENHLNGRISATTDSNFAVQNSDMAFICVGTPNLETGQLNLEYVYSTAEQIGKALVNRSGFYPIVIRSTVFPGTNQKVSEIVARQSGKIPNVDFAVVSNPEFLREGSAVEDFFNPSITVVGSDCIQAIEILKKVYCDVKAPFVETHIAAAEIIKYVNNAYHALKISFANEIGNICKSLDVDSFEVMRIFKLDTRLNISTAYFNPGMAYGGSCLPKDLKGLNTIAHDKYLNAPILNSIKASNQQQQENALKLILNQNASRISIYGLAFKRGTDDLRFSPSVDLVEHLIGKGIQVKLYDENVNLSRLVGANKSYINQHLPHLAELLVEDFYQFIEGSELIVFTHQPSPSELDFVFNNFSGKIIDFVKLPISFYQNQGSIQIEGLSW